MDITIYRHISIVLRRDGSLGRCEQRHRQAALERLGDPISNAPD
jgi:hypothetical protein